MAKLNERNMTANIVKRRTYAGLTCTETCKRLGVSRMTYYNWERKPFSLPIEKLAQMAETFRCTIEDLIEDIYE